MSFYFILTILITYTFGNLVFYFYSMLLILFVSLGVYDSLPEQAFYMVGPIEEVVQKAEKLAEEHS